MIGNVIFLQKAADFTNPPTNGVHAPVTLTFRQVGPSTITNFVIDDEIVDNLTGVAWAGFEMRLNNGSSVTFNPQMTASSGGGGPIGFSIDPFTTAQFADGNRALVISGGTVEQGETWFPGGTATDGQLWINVQSGAEGAFQVFTLVEQPAPSGQPPDCVCQIDAPDTSCPGDRNVVYTAPAGLPNHGSDLT